jgi:hypothetical protein
VDQPADIRFDARQRGVLLVDRVGDLGLARLLLAYGRCATGVLACECRLPDDDLVLVLRDVGDGGGVEVRRALHQVDLVEHLPERLRCEHRLQRIGLPLLVGGDDRALEVVLRLQQVVPGRPQPRLVVVDGAVRGLELDGRGVVLLDHAFQLSLRLLDLEVNPVRFRALRGNRIRARRRRQEGRGQKREQKREWRRDPDSEGPVGDPAEAAVSAHWRPPYQTGS